MFNTQNDLLPRMAEKRLKLDARVVFLTHYIPLYQVRVLQEIASSVRDLHILLSTPIEPNRDFVPDWSGLDVRVQDTWTLRRRWRHRAGGFADSLYVHLPYDTSRQLRALKPDVVLSHELGVRSMGAARYCRRNPHAKLVLCTYMSERSEQNRGWMRSRLRRWLVQRADAITYNGPSCRAYLLSFGVPAERLFHLPYAADDRSIYLGPLDRDEGQTRHRLLVVGQLSERKGVLPMLGQIADYCRLRPQREIELVFAGDGPLRDRIRAFPLPGNLHVKLLGNVTPDDLAVWMLRCGALLAPTLADEWMLAVNEALHAGLPVLGSVHAQAVTSLIRAGVNGWPYDPLAPGALAGILDSYFAEPAYSLSRMRREARESVAERTPQWAARGALDSIQYVMGLGKQHDRQALSERDAR